MSGDFFEEVQESPETGPPGEGEKISNFNKPGEGEGEAAAPGYREKYKVYSARYGYGLRSIKGWIAEGRAFTPPKLPPLDDPEAMLLWWHEVKNNRAPARLLAVAETARQMRVALATPSGIPPAPPEPAKASPSPQTPAPSVAVGFAASLDRVRCAEAQANIRYLTEFEKPEGQRDESKVSRCRREWSELSEQLRFLEKAAPDVLKKSGEMLTRSEMRRVLGELHAPIVQSVRQLFRRVRTKAPHNVTLDEFEKLYASAVEHLFASLVKSEFAPAHE